MHAILIAVLMTAQAPALAKDAFDLKELYRLEAVWNDAHVKGDADALAMVRSNRMPFTKYETSELNVKRFGDSALVTGRLMRERTMNGRSVADNWRFTKVYAMGQGQWRVVAWHASPAAP